MPHELLRHLGRDVRAGQLGAESMPQGMEVAVSAVAIDVGDTGPFQVAAQHLGRFAHPRSRPEGGAAVAV